MKLIDNLYTAVPVEDGECKYHITLNPEHIIYKAHFPGRPITPGVCLIQLVGEVLVRHLERHLRLVAVKNAKFITTVEPLETREFDLLLSKLSENTDGTVSVQSVMCANETVLAKMSLLYE